MPRRRSRRQRREHARHRQRSCCRSAASRAGENRHRGLCQSRDAVGQIKTAERIVGADKLLKLTVDIGTEIRQICAGIAHTMSRKN